ncbi:MAG: hypothetical protein R3F13_00575 [Prosthecobacter sp.]
MKSLPRLRSVAFLFLLVVLSSCNGAFRKAWNSASASDGVAGKWEGTWLSAENGHHGTLRCVVSQPTNDKGDRDFFYRATWKSILSGSYKAVHQVQSKKDGTYIFKGDHQMPEWAGGKYHYEGAVKGDEFDAFYKCAIDHGTFTMKRVR